MPSQEWDAYNDLDCIDFVRRANTFELSFITVKCSPFLRMHTDAGILLIRCIIRC